MLVTDAAGNMETHSPRDNKTQSYRVIKDQTIFIPLCISKDPVRPGRGISGSRKPYWFHIPSHRSGCTNTGPGLSPYGFKQRNQPAQR